MDTDLYKCMLCSKLLVAHVPHANNLVPFPILISPTVLTWWCTYSLFQRNVIIKYCKSFHCLLICPHYLSYGSDLVYRENTVRTAHVLNSVAVHFKRAEQIVILTTSVLARSLIF